MGLKNLHRDSNYFQYGEENKINLSDWGKIISKFMENNFFPDDYKEFMMTYNGGIFLERIIKNSPVGFINCSQIFSIGEKYKYAVDSDNNIEFSKSEFGSNFLCIAEDSGGDCYVMDIGVQSNGCIYYWHHDRLFPDGERMHPIFNKFTDFVNSLEMDIA